MLKVQQHTVTMAPAIAQYAAAAALTGSQDCVSEMLDAYTVRREMVVDGLNALPGVQCAAPEGAFYAFPDISGTGMTSDEFSSTMLEKARVAMTPGSAFGPAGEGYVRLSFANSNQLLEHTIERLREAL
jgi:aspartate aminotransferase